MFYPSGFSSIQLLCYLVFSSKFSSNNFFTVIQGGVRDLSRNLPPIALRSVCIGRFVLLTILVNSQMRAYSFWIFDGAILLSTGSYFKEVDFNVPPTILIAELSWVSSLLVCALFIQTGAQYSSAEYTSTSVLIRNVFGSAPHDVPLNLTIILGYVFIFVDNITRCSLNIDGLSSTAPKYLG